jgi:serine/threonine protein kinase/tetratricopeptide (TPR) repeat protein
MGLRSRLAFRETTARESLIPLVLLPFFEIFFQNPCARRLPISHGRVRNSRKGHPVNERDLFIAALQIEDPAGRAAYLDKTCGDDAELRRRVEALLAALGQAGSFLQQPAVAATTDSTPADPSRNSDRDERPGIIIGPYKLLQQIGEGGMGTVYMAEQTTPIHRKVALKIIKAGMDSKQVIARFEAERQALALMDHPNIAKVFDAGTTESGRPYFVMELVKGESITKYCDEHRLTPRQRLELFLPVCQAIQHAHQKGIIHRDIKASNALIAPYDGKPVVKVIDFGIAKATGQRLTDKTLFTEFGAVVGTLEYMSPEQAELNNQDIDTRSDIYSLGVLLYELLTGTTPLDRTRLKKAAFAELLRIIREEEPPKPSTRLSDSKDLLPSISAQRQTEPAKLTKLMRGELDWIVMKALDKDRNRRYETANGFAGDVQRYLNDEAVQACPPSAGYRVRKFVGRNRTVLSTAALVFATLMVGTGVSIWQAVRATHAETQTQAELEERIKQYTRAESERLRAEANFLRTLEAVDQLLSEMGQKELASVPHLEPVRRRLLEKALEFFEGFMKERSGDARVRYETGLAYRRAGEIRNLLGEFDKARSAYVDAIGLLEPLCKEEPRQCPYQRELGKAHYGLGFLQADMGQREESEKNFNTARDLQVKLVALPESLPADRNDLATTCKSLGGLLSKAGRNQEAEQVLNQGMKILESLSQEFPDNLDFAKNFINASSTRAVLLGNLGHHEPARAAFRRSFEAASLAKKRFHSDQDILFAEVAVHSNFAFFLIRSGANEEGRLTASAALKTGEKLAADYPNIPRYRLALQTLCGNLGTLLLRSGPLDEAEMYLEKAHTISEKLAADFPTVPVYHSRVGGDLNNLAVVAGRRRQFDEQRRFLEKAIAAQQVAHKLDPKNQGYREFLYNHRHNLATVLRKLKAPADEVEAAHALAVQDAKKLLDDYPDAPVYQGLYGSALHIQAANARERGDLAHARTLVLQSISNIERASERDAKNRSLIGDLHDATFFLADLLHQMKSPDANRAKYQWVGVAKKWAPVAPALVPWDSITSGRVILVLEDTIATGADDPFEWLLLALCHGHRKNKVEARRWYEKAAAVIKKEQTSNPDLVRFRARVETVLGLKKKGESEP